MVSDFALLHQGKKMYEHNALGYWSGLVLCLTKVRSSRARCPATALISNDFQLKFFFPPFPYFRIHLYQRQKKKYFPSASVSIPPHWLHWSQSHSLYIDNHRDFPTLSKQGPGTNDFGKNNTYISQIGKMDTKQNR